MKIDTYSVVQRTPRIAASSDKGVAIRVALATVLGLTLVWAMQWALNVTNANARQVSQNLSNLQNHFDGPVTNPTEDRNDLGFPERRKNKTARNPDSNPQ